MPEKIAEFARLTQQPVPSAPGEFVRCALESLAYAYRRTLDALEGATARTFSRIHIVGGGSRNELLNQLTADVTRREVVAGPVEATALGNGLTQALARGDLRDLADLRRAVRQGSRDLLTYQPRGQDVPEELGERVWEFAESVGR
jgi:rhamnulokinase